MRGRALRAPCRAPRSRRPRASEPAGRSARGATDARDGPGATDDAPRRFDREPPRWGRRRRPSSRCASTGASAEPRRVRAGHAPEGGLGERVDVGVDLLLGPLGFPRGQVAQERRGDDLRLRVVVVVEQVVGAADLDLVVDDDGAVRVGRGRRSDLDEPLDVLQELAERDGLVDVVLGARPELLVLLERLVARLARHDDERDVLEVRILLELVADREPVHARQLDGEQDEVRLLRRGLLQTHVAVVHHGGRASEAAELAPQLTGEYDVALEYENFGRHGS